MLPILTKVLTGNFLLLLLYLGCTTNQGSISFGYICNLLVLGHHGPFVFSGVCVAEELEVGYGVRRLQQLMYRHSWSLF